MIVRFFFPHDSLMEFGKSIKNSFLVYPTCLLTFTKSSHRTCLFGPPRLRSFHKISTLLVYLEPESTIVNLIDRLHSSLIQLCMSRDTVEQGKNTIGQLTVITHENSDVSK